MSIALKFTHFDGLLLRQQSSHKVVRSMTTDATGKSVPTIESYVTEGTEWKFDAGPDRKILELGQDTDDRRRDASGKPVKLGTYTAHISAGLKNLVVENSGKSKNVEFRNASVRNQMKVRYQQNTELKNAKGDGKHFEWKDSAPPQYVAPNTWSGVFVGDGQRAILDEMPT